MPKTAQISFHRLLPVVLCLFTLLFAFRGLGHLRGQAIPIDSLYVNGTGGEEMGADYSITLNEGSRFRIRWNMNTVSTREGYSIYCGLQKNAGGYSIVEPAKDMTEDVLVPTTYDFACRSCVTGTLSSCFSPATTDYITTYQRSVRVLPNGQSGIVPPPSSSISVPSASSVFVVRGTMDEQVSGESLVLKPGSQARFAWSIPANSRGYTYSVYCGMGKNGGPLVQVPTANDSVEQVASATAYEFACRSCPNWKDYDGYVDPIVPWNNCWNPSNADFIEIIRKRVVVSRMAYCGDSKVTGAEQCDDGTNTTPGDGCSMSCALESGWTCVGEPSRCNKCGNAVREGRETCDDGNTESGDGCDSFCFAEPGYTCTGTSCVSIACSDGIDNDGDGLIDAQGNRESYTQLFGNEAQIRTYLNGVSALVTPQAVQENEFACEDIPGVSEADRRDSAADKFCRLFQYDDAVSVSCVNNSYDNLKGIWAVWHGEQVIREPSNYGNYPYYNTIRCAINPDCSDGVDNDYDGKTDMADSGCTNRQDTSELAADSGCAGPDDPTEGTCGDGKKEPAEQCDDGNVKSGDGCSAECRKESTAQASSAQGLTISSAAAAGANAAVSRSSSSVFGVVASVSNAAASVGQAATGVAVSSFKSSVQAYQQGTATQYSSFSTRASSVQAFQQNAAAQYASVPQSSSQTASVPAAGSVPGNTFRSSSETYAAPSSFPGATAASAGATGTANSVVPSSIQSEMVRQSSADSLLSPFPLPLIEFPLGQRSQSSEIRPFLNTAPETGPSGDPVRPAAPEAGHCADDLCSFGRRCIEIVDGAPDCILAGYEQGEYEPDANYASMIRTNAEAMHTRCMVLNAIWGAEGYGCLETFVFPYVRQIPLQEPTAFRWTRWIGDLLAF